MTLEQHVITSSCGEYTRDIWLLPSPAGQAHRLCIFLDAEFYLRDIDRLPILDALLSSGAVPPLTCLFVSHLSREARHHDLICNSRYGRSDSIKTAEVLLSAGLDLNKEAFSEENFKATPLWYAVAFGQNFKLAEYLLQRGSDPNHCLFAAAYNDDVDMIRLLVTHGGPIDPDVEDASPLLFAVQWSRLAAAEELLKLGADVNFQNSKKMTALHYMLKKGTDLKYIRMLMNYGARGDLENANGDTAAEIMMRKRDPDLRKLAAQLL